MQKDLLRLKIKVAVMETLMGFERTQEVREKA
jgi:hypothetical protein